MDDKTRKNDKAIASPMRKSKNASEVVTPQPSERSQGALKKAKRDGGASLAAMKRNLRNYFGTPTGKAPTEKGKGKGKDTGEVSGKGTNDGGRLKRRKGGSRWILAR